MKGHKIYILLFVLFVAMMVAGFGIWKTARVSQTVSDKSADEKLVVIDAGHGGVDPGKVGINGAYEKDVNLAICLVLKKELENAGCKVVMTREKDEGLYSDSDTNKKVADLRKRVELMNSSGADAIVSIHQNSFEQESSKGAQVFYQATSTEGQKFAELMQSQLVADLNTENNRKAKPNSDYYLLKNTTETAIIVECGFLSNSSEAQLLCSDEYQAKVAESVAAGVIKYLEDAR